MAIAVRTDAYLATPFTYAAFYAQLKTSLGTAGFTDLVDEYVSGSNQYLVYRLTVDATKGQGVTYLRFRSGSDFSMSSAIGTAWNTSTKALANASSEITYNSVGTGSNLQFVSVKAAPEFCCLLISSSNGITPVVALSPVNRPAWWNLDAYPYHFLTRDYNLNTWRPPTSTQWGNADFSSSLNNGYLGGVNRGSGKRDIGYGFILYAPNNEGYVGRTSDELCVMAAYGLGRFNLLRVDGSPNRDYVILCDVSGGLGARIA